MFRAPKSAQRVILPQLPIDHQRLMLLPRRGSAIGAGLVPAPSPMNVKPPSIARLNEPLTCHTISKRNSFTFGGSYVSVWRYLWRVSTAARVPTACHPAGCRPTEMDTSRHFRRGRLLSHRLLGRGLAAGANTRPIHESGDHVHQ